MLFDITHRTTYAYADAVKLTPHVLRLRPRADAHQTLQAFEQIVTPKPQGSARAIDVDGNTIDKLWFDAATDRLKIETRSYVETHLTNPFHFLLEPWAVSLPIDYPTSLRSQLQPYLQHQGFEDAITPQLARDLWSEARGNTVSFVSLACQLIYRECDYILRETGDPFPAGLTWQQKRGSCRDFVVVLAEICRAANLAARFVSGYQAGDPDTTEHHLHAWAEVYLPGAGWRGYDPTLGLAVSDRHIALASSAYPRYAAPVEGSVRGQSQPAQMDYAVSVREVIGESDRPPARATMTQTQSR